MIDLKNVDKFYEGDTYKIQALSSVNLHMDEGELLSIMGRSGSGKTTLLNIIGFLDVVSSGSFSFLGKDVSELTSKELWKFRRDYIGFVFQQFALINHSSVFENVALPLEAIGMSKKERRKKVNEALEQLGISDLKDKYPGQISGGQKQRVAIARAIVCNPRVLLADEPTGALDVRTGDEIMAVFKELNKTGKTIIIVTHDEKIANQTNRIITLEDSHLVSDKAI